MTRQAMPSILLPPLLFGLFALVASPAPAQSQDRFTQDRLDRLERDLNMLQRQVYRGAPISSSGDGNLAVGAELRIDRVEAQMRDLTGRIEEYANQVEQLKQRLEQVSSDIDMRLGQGSAPVAAAPPAAAAPSRSNAAAAAGTPRTRQSASLDPISGGAGAYPSSGTLTPPDLSPGTAVQPPAGPAPIFGTLSPPGTPSNIPELASAGAPHPAGALPGGSASQQYNHAFGLLKQADYPAAEEALRAFVQQHPDDAMAGNAQYWIGETLYARAKYGEAAAAFAEGYKRYPKSPKAAEDLLKLGMSLGHTNQKQSACVAFAQLDRDFPNPSAAIRERVQTEKRRVGC